MGCKHLSVATSEFWPAKMDSKAATMGKIREWFKAKVVTNTQTWVSHAFGNLCKVAKCGYLYCWRSAPWPLCYGSPMQSYTSMLAPSSMPAGKWTRVKPRQSGKRNSPIQVTFFRNCHIGTVHPMFSTRIVHRWLYLPFIIIPRNPSRFLCLTFKHV